MSEAPRLFFGALYPAEGGAKEDPLVFIGG
jgi:hypothetical protein